MRVVQGKIWNIFVICGKFARDRWVLADEEQNCRGWRNIEFVQGG